MFPHTPHMELVMVFERVDYEAEEPIPSFAGHYQPSAADAAAAAAATTTATASASATETPAETSPTETSPTEPTPAAAGPDQAASAETPTEAVNREVTSDHPLVPNPSPAVDNDAVVETA